MYFLVKNHVPHTTTFESLITLLIENGDIQLNRHCNICPQNATYESYTTIVELLASISKTLKQKFLTSLQASQYYSLMADESTDIASQEELSVCARCLRDNKAVEHFLGIIHAKETNAKAISELFFNLMALTFIRCGGLGLMVYKHN